MIGRAALKSVANELAIAFQTGYAADAIATVETHYTLLGELS
jgi:hypothetical protein